MNVELDVPQLTGQVATVGDVAFIVMVIIGFGLVALGVWAAAMTGSNNAARGGTGIKAALTSIAIGGILISGSTLLDIGSLTLGANDDQGQNAREAVLSGEPVTGEDVPGDIQGSNVSIQDATAFAYTVVGVVGFIGFISGWLMLAQMGRGTASQTASMGKAITLIIGGVLAVNMPWTVDMVANTMGIEIFQN